MGDGGADNVSGGRLTVAELVRRADFDLGRTRVSPSSRVIRGPGGQANLEPRTMQVLLLLADASGAVVTRDELFRRCWGAAIVGDDSLNRVVADIRRVARTVGEESFSIETVPRTGYRLLAQSAGDSVGSDATSDGAPPRRQHRRALLLAAPAAAAACAGAYWLLRPQPRREVEGLVVQSERALRSATPEGMAQAAELLERAASLSPRDPVVWGRLALAQSGRVEMVPPGLAPGLVATVEEAARHALALDPGQADAHAALALLPPYFGDWLAAERRMRSVLQAAPGHLATLDALAFLLVAVGRARESAALRLTFSPREPLHAGHQYRLIYAYWILGRIGEADRAGERAAQLWPRHIAIWFARLWVLAFTGRAERAMAHLADAEARPELPESMIDTLSAAIRAIDSRRPADRSAAVSRLLEEVSLSPSNAINAILLLSGMGAMDAAFEVAEAYLLETGPLMASVRWRTGQVAVNDQRRRKTHMLFVPATAPMRGDPRFDALARRVGLAAYWSAAGVRRDGDLWRG